MDILELRNKKSELEKEITSKLLQFESECDVTIKSVDSLFISPNSYLDDKFTSLSFSIKI